MADAAPSIGDGDNDAVDVEEPFVILSEPSVVGAVICAPLPKCQEKRSDVSPCLEYAMVRGFFVEMLETYGRKRA
jgi:hypothetical protein